MSSTTTMSFRLPFPPEEIEAWAAQYWYPGESVIEDEVAPGVRARGYLEHADLVAFARWMGLRYGATTIKALEARDVENASRIALSAGLEGARFDALDALRGVGPGLTSVVLHWCDPAGYPVWSFPSLHALGYEEVPAFSHGRWNAYTTWSRAEAARARVSLRTFDRALSAWTTTNGTGKSR